MASYNHANIVNHKHIDINIDKDECKSHNFIWENKGIALGIIHYVLNVVDDLGHNPRKVKEAKKRVNIIIKIKRFRRIIRRLFPDLKVTKAPVKTMEHYYVSIKTAERRGLIINNLDNLEAIKAQNIYLLPCYDPDNPIVYYEYNEDKSLDVKEVRKSVDTFTECFRGRVHCSENYVTERCKLYTWDPCVEYKILRRYVQAYQAHKNDLPWVYKYVSNRTRDDYCPEKRKRKRVYVNVPVEVPVPTPYPVKVPVKVPVDRVVEKIKEDPEKDRLIAALKAEITRLKAIITRPVPPAPAPAVAPPPVVITRTVKEVDHALYYDLIESLANKIEILNRVMEEKDKLE